MVTQFEVISKWLGVNIIGAVLARGTKENMSVHLHIFFICKNEITEPRKFILLPIFTIIMFILRL